MSKILFLPLVLILCACAALPSGTPTPEPANTPAASASAACPSPSSWSIEYKRTGGIGGFNQSLTLQSDGSLSIQSEKPVFNKQTTLPKDHLQPIENLLAQACPFEVGRAAGVCADCFNYELNIEMDGKTYNVQATDTTLTEDLHPLINTLDEFFKVTGQ